MTLEREPPSIKYRNKALKIICNSLVLMCDFKIKKEKENSIWHVFMYSSLFVYKENVSFWKKSDRR